MTADHDTQFWFDSSVNNHLITGPPKSGRFGYQMVELFKIQYGFQMVIHFSNFYEKRWNIFFCIFSHLTQPLFDHSKSRLIWISDTHCIQIQEYFIQILNGIRKPDHLATGQLIMFEYQTSIWMPTVLPIFFLFLLDASPSRVVTLAAMSRNFLSPNGEHVVICIVLKSFRVAIVIVLKSCHLAIVVLKSFRVAIVIVLESEHMVVVVVCLKSEPAAVVAIGMIWAKKNYKLQ